MPGELRIPPQLLLTALQGKEIKALRLLAAAKLEGHRSEIKPLCACLKIKPKTCQRLVKKLVCVGWARSDGQHLFPRSWQNLKFNKRGGLYLTALPKKLKRFEALCFTHALKRILSSWKAKLKMEKELERELSSRKASPVRPGKGRSKFCPDLPTTALCAALGIKERRYKSLKAAALSYKFISVIPQYRIIGPVRDFDALRKNLHGIPVFKHCMNTVIPEISKIRVHI